MHKLTDMDFTAQNPEVSDSRQTVSGYNYMWGLRTYVMTDTTAIKKLILRLAAV